LKKTFLICSKTCPLKGDHKSQNSQIKGKVEACRINHNQNEVNKKALNEYFTKVEKQKFTKLDESSQKSYLAFVGL
jgi:hypothetical protein